jgi:hypothetical protein
LAQFEVPTLRDTLIASAEPPAKAAYLKVLAEGLNLLDAVKDLRAVLHDQAKAALENGDVVPGYTLSAGRAERRWRDDERTTIAAPKRLKLRRDDIITSQLRSPRQIEVRAKARGLKVQQKLDQLIVSQRSGTSLVRSENAHAPVPGRNELAQLFTRAIEAFHKEVGCP